LLFTFAKLVSFESEYIAEALLAEAEIGPVVFNAFVPSVNGALNVAPFAVKVPVRVALEAYKLFQVELLDPMSYASLLDGSKLVPRLVMEPGCTVKLLLMFAKLVSLDRAYMALARAADEATDPVVVNELAPNARGAVRVAPLAERDPVSVTLEAYKFLQVELLEPIS
jgi:hypothetical protein